MADELFFSVLQLVYFGFYQLALDVLPESLDMALPCTRESVNI